MIAFNHKMFELHENVPKGILYVAIGKCDS